MSLQALVQKVTQFQTFVDCFLHPEKLKQENDKLLSSSLTEVYLTVTFEELKLAMKCGESLNCRLDEMVEFRETFEDLVLLREESLEFLEKANNDDDEDFDLDAVNNLLAQWRRYPIADDVIDELAKVSPLKQFCQSTSCCSWKPTCTCVIRRP